MNVLIIDNGSKHIAKLAVCFENHKVKVVKYRRHSRPDREWADIFVLSGGDRPFLFKRLYREEVKLILETRKPLIGICLGFELIAEAYGARLRRQRVKMLGIKEINVIPEYFGLESDGVYSVYEAHRWVLTDTGIFEVVGVSSRGPEIIKHPSRQIFGFQFHPEVVVPNNDGLLLLNRCVELCLV